MKQFFAVALAAVMITAPLAPASAVPVVTETAVIVLQDGWGIRARICNWLPFWC